MKSKKACLVINPRGGQNLARLTDMMAVFAAAGWKTDIAIKEYGGHTMELATRAAEAFVTARSSRTTLISVCRRAGTAYANCI